MSYSANDTTARSSWQPETFAEIGAAVPFTTPELTGARARATPRGLELTLPNPSGRRGIYILDPKEMGHYCAPSLHDRRLLARLAGLPALTPATVRLAARSVARAGFAGREAAAAAIRAQAAEQRAALAAELGLLRLLVRQTGGDTTDASGMDRAARVAIQALAARSGHELAAMLQAVGALAALLAAAGLPGDAAARGPQQLSALAAMAKDLTPHARGEGRAARAAMLVLSAVQEAAPLARKALDMLRALVADLPRLLPAFTGNPAPVEALAMRMDWLLDGWGALALVWQVTPPGRTGAALGEIALMVPFVPTEAAAWYGATANEAGRQSLRAGLLGSNDWRSGGLVHELTARNEAIRAMAA